MKVIGTTMAVACVAAASMAAGAYLVMSNKTARKAYRMGKRKITQMMS